MDTNSLQLVRWGIQISNANQDIQRLRDEHEQSRRTRERLDRLVHAIDDLLFQLEDLNLQKVDRVPPALREQAGRIFDAIPTHERHERLCVRYRIVPLMDVLFQAQEVLFQLRDPQREALYGDDAEEGSGEIDI